MTMETQEVDPAPYGVRLDGSPRKRPGRPPGARNKTPRKSAGNAVRGNSPYRRVVVTEQEPAGEELPDEGAGLGAVVEGDGLQADPGSSIGAGLAAASSSSTTRSGPKGRGPTLAVKKDIRAKLAFMLGLPAGMWAMSDPICGGAFAADVPGLADALVEIICDSPDLVTWFTSGGNYMKWLTAVTAVQGTGVAIWQHHVAHSVGATHDAGIRYDPGRYPAVVPDSATG